MNYRRAFPLVVFLFLPLVLFFTACSGGGGSDLGVNDDDGGKGLYLIGIEFGENNSEKSVPRNQPVVLRFNTALDKKSAHPEGVQIVRGSTNTPHEGRVILEGEYLTFFPTALPGDPNEFNPPNNPPPNAFGFEGNSTYQIKLLVADPQFSLRNSEGRTLVGIGLGLPLVFRTVNEFMPEDPPIPPSVCSIRDFYADHPEHSSQEFPPTCDEPGDPAWGYLSPQFNPPLDPDLTITIDDEEYQPNQDHPLGDFWFFDPFVGPELEGITLLFDEPMNLNTFNSRKSFYVKNTDKGEPGKGEIIISSITYSPDGREFTLHPAFPLGRGKPPDENNPFGGYNFEIIVSKVDIKDQHLTDLGGNELANPHKLYFNTYYDPSQEEYYAFTVEFSGTAEDSNGFWVQRDPTTTTAQWPDPSHDYLEGAPAYLRIAEYSQADTGYNLPQPLSISGNRIQFLYTKADLGGAAPGASADETLVGINWGPRSNYVFKGVYQDITMKIGHTNISLGSNAKGLDFQYNKNYTLSGEPEPTVVYEGNYVCDPLVNFEWFPWPTFTQDFEYNGKNQIIFEVHVPKPLSKEQGGIPTYQLFRNWSKANTPRQRVFGPPDQSVAQAGERTVYHHQFYLIRKTSRGQSQWIDLQPGTDPEKTIKVEFEDPVVVDDKNRQGTSWKLEFQGTKEDTAGGPDKNSWTDWYEDLKELNYSRSGQMNEYMRFRFTLRANVSTFSLDDYWNLPDPTTTYYSAPRIDSLSIIWKQEDVEN